MLIILLRHYTNIMNRGINVERNIKDLVQQMTLEEKAGMCSGLDFWHLKGVERLGIPSIMVTDGPHGLRKQDSSADHLGLTSRSCNLFPVCRRAGEFVGYRAGAPGGRGFG